MAIVFLDANVLFRAAYRPDAGLLRLWSLRGVQLVSSDYAVEEAQRNLAAADQRERLRSLVGELNMFSMIPEVDLPDGIELPAKDQPILLGAIGAGASHLLTGDFAHFGRLYGSSVAGVLILSPAEFLRTRLVDVPNRPVRSQKTGHCSTEQE